MGRSGAQRPPTAWAVEHSGGLLITYWLALTFFYIFVRPAVGTDFPDSSLFIAAAAAAHTAMAGIGFGAAEKEESSLWTAILPLLSFGGWTAMLSLCFTLGIGRFRAWSNAFSLDTASTAILQRSAPQNLLVPILLSNQRHSFPFASSMTPPDP